VWYIKTVRSGKRFPDGSLPPEVWQEGGVCPTLNAFDNGSESRATVAIVGTLQSFPRGVPSSEEVAGGQAVINGSNVRRLVPIECERLQGFPDNWTEGLADSHRYKQMGNAVTVNVAHYVGSLIMEAYDESQV